MMTKSVVHTKPLMWAGFALLATLSSAFAEGKSAAAPAKAPEACSCGEMEGSASVEVPAALSGNHSFLAPFFTGAQALAADDFGGAQAAFKKWGEGLASAKTVKAAVQSEFKKAAADLAAAKDLAGLRKALNGASKVVIAYCREQGLDHKGVHFFYCPMAKGNWVGLSSEVQNPYYGKSMLSCGSEVSAAK